MQLQLSTWPDVERYLQRATDIIIPVGSTEQHGPNGLIGTDAICPQAIATALSERHDILVGPTLNLGMAQHHLGFPGTISLRPATLAAIIRDTVNSLARHGFSHILFLNGHGGNIATIHSTFAELYAGRSFSGITTEHGPELALHNWFLGKRVRQLAEKLYGPAEGGHATPSEVSLSWHAHPEAARRDVSMQPRIAPSGHANRDADDFRRHFPDGRMGSDPSLASIEDGREFLEAGVADALEIWQAFTNRPARA